MAKTDFNAKLIEGVKFDSGKLKWSLLPEEEIEDI